MLAIFLDIETTGLDSTKHKVIDIALKVVDLSSGQLRGALQTIVKQPASEWEKQDPMSIQFNGYTWEEVSTGKEPEAIRKEIIELFTFLNIERGKAVFICQNPSFDRPFFAQLVDVYTQEILNWPYHWLDLASMYWAVSMKKRVSEKLDCPKEMNLSKNEIAKCYNLPTEAEPHRAMNGVNHLIMCYQAVLDIPLQCL